MLHHSTRAFPTLPRKHQQLLATSPPAGALLGQVEHLSHPVCLRGTTEASGRTARTRNNGSCAGEGGQLRRRPRSAGGTRSPHRHVVRELLERLEALRLPAFRRHWLMWRAQGVPAMAPLGRLCGARVNATVDADWRLPLLLAATAQLVSTVPPRAAKPPNSNTSMATYLSYRS